MSNPANDRSKIRQATTTSELLDLEIPPSDGSPIKGGWIDEFSSFRTLTIPSPSASRSREGYAELVEMSLFNP